MCQRVMNHGAPKPNAMRTDRAVVAADCRRLPGRSRRCADLETLALTDGKRGVCNL
jgi:hypothetical protein